MPSFIPRLAAYAVPLLVVAGCAHKAPVASTAEAASSEACPPVTPTCPTAEPVVRPFERKPGQPVYLAFSGGGWHTHTAMAGWMAGLLDASGESDLDAVLTHVDAIASNSGGSWFLTHLAFSTPFRDDLEHRRDAWMKKEFDGKTGGYMGQIEVLFHDREPCEGWSGAEWAVCEAIPALHPLFEVLGMQGGGTLNWRAFIRDVTFAPYGMNRGLASVRLGDAKQRQRWAADKDLVISASLLTDDVVLTDHGCWLARKDQAVSARPTDAAAPDPANVTPLVFSSIGSGRQPPALLTAGDTTASYGRLRARLRETRAYAADHPADVLVIDAATASSAAPAALASAGAIDAATVLHMGGGELAYVASDLAPAVRFEQADLVFQDTVPRASSRSLARRGMVRVADGGYIDNTAVAYLMRYLDDNALLVDGFEIVSFMNSGGAKDVDVCGVSLPQSTAALFGYGETSDGTLDYCAYGMHLDTPSPGVFDAAALVGATPTWEHTDGDVTLRHFALDVTTTSNRTFGIDAGVRGRLQVFISANLKSGALPYDESIMQAYAQVYDVTRAGAGSDHGSAVLRAALGLDAPAGSVGGE